MKKSVIILLAIVVIAATAYIAYNNFGKETVAPIDSAASSGDAAEEVTLQDLDMRLLELGGSTKRISDYSEGILFLNFWATWCGYCELEMPDLIEIDKQMRSEGIGKVVAIDVNEKEAVVKAYLEKQGFTGLTVLLDLDGEAAKKFDIEGYPTTFVFKNGVLMDYKVGMMSKEAMEALLERAR